MPGTLDSLELVSLSALPADERARLLDRYDREVYRPAFPDHELREDPALWRTLLGADPYPPPPQPLIDVLLLRGEEEAILGGATIEYYRTACSGLLTYVAVAAHARGRGAGRRLVAGAHAALARIAGPAVPLFAETERLEEAGDADERAATHTRQRQLDGLGARMLDFEYVMPPLRPGLPPKRLHLMILLKAGDRLLSVPAATVRGLVTELAASLGADLTDHTETRQMLARLDEGQAIRLRPLPAVGRRDG